MNEKEKKNEISIHTTGEIYEVEKWDDFGTSQTIARIH